MTGFFSELMKGMMFLVDSLPPNVLKQRDEKNDSKKKEDQSFE